MPNIKILTLGCAKNTVDSEKIAGNLKTNNINVSFCNEPQKCDILIINTCGFILDAKEESIEAILEAIELKKQHQIKKYMLRAVFQHVILKIYLNLFPK